MTKAILSFFCAGALLSAAPLTNVKLVNYGSPAITDSFHNEVGAYTLSFNGQSYATLPMNLADTEINTGTTFTATITPVGVSDTYYREEAYLFNLLTKTGVTSQDRKDIQDAAWYLSGDYSHSSLDMAAKNDVTSALNNYKNVVYSNYEVVSVVSDCRDTQTFLIDPSASASAPEPASYALFGLGLGLAGFSRKFFKRGVKA